MMRPAVGATSIGLLVLLLWSLVVLVVANAVTIGTMLLVRRRAPEGSYFTDGDRASGVFGVLAGGFAIFAGFIIFLAFTTYDESRVGGETEALSVIQQFETAEFLPPATRDRLSGEIACYARSVVHQEWPAMERGEGGDTINPWALALFRSMKASDPRTAGEQAAYSKWLDQTSDREAARNDRLHGAEGIIPSTIWIVLILIALVVFAYMLFFADPAEGVLAQAMLMGSATTVIVLTLAAINALDSPYRAGPGQIQPTAMERTIKLIDDAPPSGGRPRSRAASRACRWRPDGRPPRAQVRARRDAAARGRGGRVDARGERREPAGPGRRRPVHAMGRRLRARGGRALAFYRKRFRPEFVPAFERGRPSGLSRRSR